MKRLLRSGALAIVLAMSASVSGCVDPQGGGLFSGSFWSGSPFFQGSNDEAERGLAELAKGNFTQAEGLFKRALEINQRDVHALLGLGILYQNTNQTTKAREMYEAILAIRPKESDRFVVWRSLATKSINEIASVNLALLESGGVLADLGRGAAGQTGMDASTAPPKLTPSPMASGSAGGMALRTPTPKTIADAPSMPMIPVGDVNVINRFKTLMALRDEGLVTQDEFDARRRTNIGSLLPLTSPPPASGLDRPVPTTGQISSRLRAIGRALEMRALTVSQHASERSMILDALMPAAPVRVANPGPPPNGLLEAADRVRLLEKLKEEKIISSDEYTRERKAIELAMQPAPTARPRAKKPAAASDAPSMSLGKGTPQPAVHIASFRSQKAAERGWAQIRRAHRKLLGSYKHAITRVNLGPGKGIFYRLMVGPIKTKAASVRLCRQLKQRRQFCEPGFITL